VPEIEKTANLVEEITAANLEQNDNIDQINNAIQQLNQVTQQNAASSEEMATSSEELMQHAQELKNLIAFFRINLQDAVDKSIARKVKKESSYAGHAYPEPKTSNKGTAALKPKSAYKPATKDDDYENF